MYFSYFLPEMTHLLRMQMVKFVQMKHVKSKAGFRESDLAENQHDYELFLGGWQITRYE